MAGQQNKTAKSFKKSSKANLTYQAKIIKALKDANKPLSGIELAQSVCGSKSRTTKSSVYTNFEILIKTGLMKEVDDKYVLWSYKNKLSEWDKLSRSLQDSRGELIEIEVEKIKMIEVQPDFVNTLTPHTEEVRDYTYLIEGFFIYKEAKSLMKASAIKNIAGYTAFLISQSKVENSDRFKIEGIGYRVYSVDVVRDGMKIAFYVAKLREHDF